MPNTTDYDAPRRPIIEVDTDDLAGFTARRAGSATVDVDETPSDESFDLPGADLSDEELTVRVVPMLADEFRCQRCFLVHHRSQLVTTRSGDHICTECA